MRPSDLRPSINRGRDGDRPLRESAPVLFSSATRRENEKGGGGYVWHFCVLTSSCSHLEGEPYANYYLIAFTERE